jgi:hypothetical protein
MVNIKGGITPAFDITDSCINANGSDNFYNSVKSVKLYYIGFNPFFNKDNFIFV